MRNWKCFEIHTRSYEERNHMVAEIVQLVKQLKHDSHLVTYFFNRYSNPANNLYFIKLGLVNSDENTEAKLNELFRKYVRPEDIKPYICEMWEVNGIPIDELKCLSCEMSEIIIEHLDTKPTTTQAFYLLHFLMNQLGFSYDEEIIVYKNLAECITSELKKRKTA